ncbi:MAG: glycosyltransferase involved in cell wall biosynthesis [Flavobacteriaceae bacterium]|jgi:glycosyltransferase involved in cell wall biosynthesis
MKKVVLASGSRHTIPPIGSSPGMARTIYTIAESEPSSIEYKVISKYDNAIESLNFDKKKYYHPQPRLWDKLLIFILNKIPYRIKKKIFGFTQADRILYYYGIKRLIKKINPEVIVTVMHYELFKILHQAFPNSKHIYFYQSTDIIGRLSKDKINYLINNANGFMANTQMAIQEFESHYKNKKIPTATVYNGLKLINRSNDSIENIRKLKREEYSLDSKDFVIGYAGRFSHEKSLLEILEALKILKEQEIVVHLFIAGDIKYERTPDYNYYNKVLNFIENNLKGQVHFYGWVVFEELYDFYASINVGVLISKYREGNSMFITEALSVGVPIIANRVGGNIEIIENNNIGFLIENHDVAKLLANKIKFLFDDKILLRQFSNNAIEYAKRKHSKSALVKSFNKYIKQFI